MSIRSLFLVMVAGTISITPLPADDDHRHQRGNWIEHEKVLPLEQILALHRERIQGRLLDLEVEQAHGKIIYEVEYMDSRGVVHEIHIDARTGALLKEEIED